MAECERPTTTCGCWPSKRDCLSIGYSWGYAQATADIHKMQQQRPPMSGDGWFQSILSGIKVWVDRYELAQKLWALRRPAGLTILIASWWEQLMWLVRLIIG